MDVDLRLWTCLHKSMISTDRCLTCRLPFSSNCKLTPLCHVLTPFHQMPTHLQQPLKPPPHLPLTRSPMTSLTYNTSTVALIRIALSLLFRPTCTMYNIRSKMLQCLLSILLFAWTTLCFMSLVYSSSSPLSTRPVTYTCSHWTILSLKTSAIPVLLLLTMMMSQSGLWLWL